jgi:hypothetical protein
MSKVFTLPSLEERRKEFSKYTGKDIGLDTKKGIIYGVVIGEDLNDVHLNPHLAYNPIPLPDGKITNNLKKRKFIKKVPKNILTNLVYEYSEGYLDKLVKTTGEQDNYLIDEFNIIHSSKEKITRKEKFKIIYNLFFK